ncbi:MAG: peptidyl-prolyl cis-trans isomerase [Agathobacter sp.]|nr:peptidyl-prolyl cis-trans isomerase [Agathobacter sp.]
MRAKKLTAILLAGALCASALTGCGINKNATAATMNDQEVSLGIVNFYCRFQQASYEDMYKNAMGTDKDIWSMDLYGNGTTMADSLKDSTMEDLHAMYTLQAHMSDYKVALTDEEKSAIKDAAAKFIESNSKNVLDEMSADQETIEEFLTLYTIKDKMREAIEAEADTNVSAEEANMRGYSMITISTTGYTDDSGNQVEYSDDEKALIKENVQKMQDELQADGATLESVAKNYSYEVTNGTYAKDDTTLDEAVKTALDGLKEGENSPLIETESAYYFVRLDKETDEDATEKNRESIINTRKTDHYNEVLTGWQENDGWKVKDKVLAKISFKNSLTQKDPNASAETENVQSTQ